MDDAEDIAAKLNCVPRTPAVLPRQWHRAGAGWGDRRYHNQNALVERERVSGLKMTQQGHEVFKVLIGG
jgi:hypothetical protein